MCNNVDTALEDLSCATERPVSHDESVYERPAGISGRERSAVTHIFNPGTAGLRSRVLRESMIASARQRRPCRETRVARVQANQPHPRAYLRLQRVAGPRGRRPYPPRGCLFPGRLAPGPVALFHHCIAVADAAGFDFDAHLFSSGLRDFAFNEFQGAIRVSNLHDTHL